MMRSFVALLILLASSRPVFAQPFPGCPDGTVLSDPRAYIFALIHRVPGQDASDWEQVLQASGLPATPSDPAASRQPLNAPHYGITQWKGSAGNVRGRLALPTDLPDANGYFTTSVDLLADKPGGGLQWAWIERHDGAPYAPRRCGTTPPVEPPVVTPPASDGVLEALAALRKQIENLQAAVEELKAKPIVLPPFPTYEASLPLRLGTLTLRPKQ